MEPRMDFYKASPGALQAMLGLEKQIDKSGIEKPLAELVRLRASQINGCAYCADMHATDARKGGETDRRLDTLVAWRETPFFTDRERAALAWTESLTLVAETHVPDEVWNIVRPHFSDQELADLTLLIVAINGWNRFAVGLRKMPG
ncbi:carboxymuconolactone decarboxylase family protein [Pollutimonas sp. H1-120]|uniref:carboxymuconolactone decarboxylase family protein n=1 Tax=Pollutimonas sp. H1-120 TaxID=3148824 RepID=UPI003B51F948